MKNISNCLIFYIAVMFLFSGCGLVGGNHQRDEKEEQGILGSIDERDSRIREIKYCLQMAGFEPGLDEEALDSDTRNAIMKFQKYNDLAATGYIGLETWEKLKAYQQQESNAGLASGSSEANRASVKNAKREEINLQEIKSRLKSSEWIKKIQEALKNAGFDPGAIDGKVGALTKDAIRKFQESVGLSPDGVIGPKTWAELSVYFPQPIDDLNLQ